MPGQTPSSSSTSLLSSSTKSSSTATLVPTNNAGQNSSATKPTKNYADSFATLSSSYGFGGTAPVVPRKKDKTKKSSK
ncbi:hypothetical protein JAAARDRAFT_74759 [Jaapia argillacea MUCL 33604]|uniref:Uncharacterized protein n=1 Tax=Jaapia argillacea MUCL 33604 TaxID=933084 RepID=A0A067P5W7_9AGAM|nr:hypothetical protein JAAARDRAFT_74759 [Jaapia argillacea MUCL 33604]